eukprot:1116321-Rhodomonas_salina.1
MSACDANCRILSLYLRCATHGHERRTAREREGGALTHSRARQQASPPCACARCPCSGHSARTPSRPDPMRGWRWGH